MLKKFNKYFFIFISVFLMLFMSTAPSFAKEVNNLYIYRGRDANTVSNLINQHIIKKKYYTYKADVNQGFFYFQPKYMGIYSDGDFMIISVEKTESNDTLVFIRCNDGSIVMQNILLKFLEKNNCRKEISKDKDLIDKFSVKVTEKLAIKPQNISTEEVKTTIPDTQNNNQPTTTNKIPVAAQNITNKLSSEVSVVSTKEKNKTPSISPKLTNKNITEPKSSDFREISKAGVIFNNLNRGIVIVYSSVGHRSGFLVDKSGLVLTNYHVVREQGDDLKVRFGKGEVLQAKVVSIDPVNDVAVIWVNLDKIQNYTVLPLFNPPSSEPLVYVGESVIAIGSPLNWEDYEKTLTQGVVGKFENGVIMHDASVNHGNSGGPLVNFGGYVVGINSFVPSNEDNNGLSGAIAINRAFPTFDKAFFAIQSMNKPSPEILPDIPSVSYSYEIMKNEYSKNRFNGNADINKRGAPYVINSWNYDIFLVTPTQAYRKLAQEEDETLAKHKKRLDKAGRTVSPEEYTSKTLAEIGYKKPLVEVMIMPKPQMTPGSMVLGVLDFTVGILAATSGGPYYPTRSTYQYEYKKDFDKLVLSNNTKNITCKHINSGKAPITNDILEYYKSQNIEMKDKSYIGVYEFDPKDFYNIDEMNFQIYSMDGKPPKFIKIPQDFKNYIVEDFMPYWKYIENLNKNSNNGI